MTADATGAMTAPDAATILGIRLERMTAERDRLRSALAEMKRQHKTLRQQLRREQAEHLATHKRLEALRAMLPQKNSPC